MIEEQIDRIKKTLPQDVHLVAVSKFQPIAAIEQAYAVGQRLFGESRPQELAEKHAKLPKDIQWHFIGHLQTNKIRLIIPFVTLIHSIDSYRLAEAVSVEAIKAGRVVDVLLQVHIASEQTKQGFGVDEIEKLMDSGILKEWSGIRVVGLMGMATYTDDRTLIEHEFNTLALLFRRYNLLILSMGMSEDYPLAVECGSNMVRIGSSIFGQRY